MRYELIHINSFMYAIKQGLPFHLRPIKAVGGAWVYSDKIIATNDPSLNLPLLPAVEEENVENENWYKSAISVLKDEHSIKMAKLCLKAGYKAASSKQFTEEDMLRLAIYCWNIASRPVAGKVYNVNEVVKDYIQSLKPKPVIVELEIDFITTDEDYNYAISETHKLIVDENNYVNIIKWYYE